MASLGEVFVKKNLEWGFVYFGLFLLYFFFFFFVGFFFFWGGGVGDGGR